MPLSVLCPLVNSQTSKKWRKSALIRFTSDICGGVLTCYRIIMSDDALILAIGRLENALTRAERAAERAENRPAAAAPIGDPGLATRHAALKAEAAKAVEAMDKILGGANG